MAIVRLGVTGWAVVGPRLLAVELISAAGMLYPPPDVIISEGSHTYLALGRLLHIHGTVAPTCEFTGPAAADLEAGMSPYSYYVNCGTRLPLPESPARWILPSGASCTVLCSNPTFVTPATPLAVSLRYTCTRTGSTAKLTATPIQDAKLNTAASAGTKLSCM